MATWNESLKIGVPLIDVQHQQLFDQMDLLVDSIRNKKDFKQIKNILHFLKMYVANHFGYEEQCMHLYKCPMAGQNQLAHLYFNKRLTEIEVLVDSAQSLDHVADKVSQELIHWFVNHVRGIDSNLGPCAQPTG
ncbi:hemerythrin [Leptolyngbya sp. BL0902]|uniref:bacteriohemerythrin n=1 Tax=Leptolyngbya sp. BL0902 TaxID=1115757 RepID=UPI0018E88F5F|nr:hemerythrin family protein [Leptolyngbya sp. BL0902]QQE64649.1 hemerythrin [Leptolyngbya sp. BL0902]